MRGTYEASPFGFPVRIMNQIQTGQSDQGCLSFYHGKLTQLKHSVGTRAFTMSSPALPLNLCFKA